MLWTYVLNITLLFQMGVNKNQLISFTEQIILILQVISKYGFYNFSQVLRFYAVRKLNNRTSENLLVS